MSQSLEKFGGDSIQLNLKELSRSAINPNSNGHPATLNTDGILNILSTKTWTNTPKVVREQL